MNNRQTPNASYKINVLIVDDHPIIREGLRKLLELEDDIAVVGESGTGEEALELAQKFNPDVVLLDINLPALNGLQVTSRLKSNNHRTAVILLTAYDDSAQLVHAMRAGASAYCPKDIQTDRLITIIRNVAHGNYVIGDKVYNESGVKDWLDAQVKELSKPHTIDDAEPFVPLSAREMEILRCVTRGLSNKEIAQELGISQQTVKNHMTSILDKLNLGGRTQAAVYALKRGWVRAEDYRPPTKNE